MQISGVCLEVWNKVEVGDGVLGGAKLIAKLKRTQDLKVRLWVYQVCTKTVNVAQEENVVEIEETWGTVGKKKFGNYLEK